LVDWHDNTVALLTHPQPWPTTDHPRRAAISSFGISGTNAHLILEQPPTDTTTHNPDTSDPRGGVDDAGAATRGLPATAGTVPLLVSAASDQALAEQAGRLRAYLDAHGDVEVSDLGHTLATGRAALARRAVVLAANRQDALDGLDALARGGSSPRLVTGAAVTGRT
ncbi:ketoacyl-synthetase C-terminal extension domain-containing protein, partial [Streptomyces sp. HPF1205]|uniref:KS-MAT linker domain-containing protein n=1 Tax=Streptomyces sp. HPF1205 TaxID=2873262 RepID=UPI0027E19B30